ncbi:hypothetical protein GQ600_22244 [Phytophthora cactorum]|nr:hypothetical protein GQ600_22244 [Phytophthora cactorum]
MPRTRPSDSAGANTDDERTTAPIFTPVLPPRLTSTSHAALVKWHGESPKALEQEKVYQTLKRAKRNRGDRASGRTPTRVPPKPPTKKQRVVEASKRGLRPAVKSEKERPKVPPHLARIARACIGSQSVVRRRMIKRQRSAANYGPSVRKETQKLLPGSNAEGVSLSSREDVTLNDVMSIPYCADTAQIGQP